MWGTCEDQSWKLSRRQALTAGSTALLAMLGAPSALSQISLGDKREENPLLVVVFLRGGADGLNIVVPYREDNYYRQRTTIGVAGPKSGGALDLDGFFGFHPSLSPILDAYKSGQMAVLHAVGSNDPTRSHFQAMAAMEKGISFEGEREVNGWLARYLAATEGTNHSPLRGLAFSDVLPESLRGSASALALNDLSNFRLGVDDYTEMERALRTMYVAKDQPSGAAGVGVLDTITALRKIDQKAYKPESGAEYPDSDLGRGLRQTALLAKNKVGLEVACVDKGGWDMHFGQAAIFGKEIDDLGKSLGAFMKDMACSGPRPCSWS